MTYTDYSLLCKLCPGELAWYLQQSSIRIVILDWLHFHEVGKCQISYIEQFTRPRWLWLNLLKDSDYIGIFYCFFSFGTILFIIPSSESPFACENLRNRNAFSHQTSHTCRPSPLIVHLIFFEPIQIPILDLDANPCFQIFLNISKTYHRIFNCNISKRRSGQELPFIFFELRAPTCLWGRYDKNPKILHFFTYISSTSIPFQHHFKTVYRATPVLHFMFWLLRCTLWLERIMSPNLKFPSLLKHYCKSP